MLRRICDTTGMGFSAVARVTEQQWIACLVEDRIGFGLDPGDELKIRETICDEIRDSGEAVVFDDASDDIKWSRHPVPVIYGFKSYCSFPVYLDDGSFFGTLCAIDPAPRRVTDEAIVEMFSDYARTVGKILSEAAAGAAAGFRALGPGRAANVAGDPPQQQHAGRARQPVHHIMPAELDRADPHQHEIGQGGDGGARGEAARGEENPQADRDVERGGRGNSRDQSRPAAGERGPHRIQFGDRDPRVR